MMKYFRAWFFIMLLTVLSCQSRSDSSNSKGSSFSDHLVVNDKDKIIEIRENCVVIIYPDTNLVQKIEKSSKELDENRVNEEISDEVHYLYLMKEYFQQKGIKIIETDKPIILFINYKGEKTKIENHSRATGILVYAFNSQKSPLKIENLIAFSVLTDELKNWNSYFDIE